LRFKDERHRRLTRFGAALGDPWISWRAWLLKNQKQARAVAGFHILEPERIFGVAVLQEIAEAFKASDA
jgi:hypothetical protein